MLLRIRFTVQGSSVSAGPLRRVDRMSERDERYGVPVKNLRTKRSAILALAGGLGLVVAGCSPGYLSDETLDMAASERSTREAVEDYQPSPEEVASAQIEADAAFLGWVCSYDPTMNEDWHDDVLCTAGADSHRPYLREWDDFVTQEELMESAREYENEMNNAG